MHSVLRTIIVNLFVVSAALSLPAQSPQAEPSAAPESPASATPEVQSPGPTAAGSATPESAAPSAAAELESPPEIPPPMVPSESGVIDAPAAAGALPKAGDPNELTPAESMAWRDLREVVLRERAIWDRLREHPDDEYEQQRANADFRTIMTAYENVIRTAPKFAEAYAAYGLLLSRTGNRDEAVRVFLKANEIDPNMPMVKNQIGNYLVEEGRYNDALGYYLAAIKLKHDEPLYHYQLGTLLREFRKFFIHDGVYSPAKIDDLIQEAFRTAARLAPENWAFIYRYAESFYDLETPNWPAALEEWTRLEERSKPGVEKQTIHLHQANVLARMGRLDEARAIVDSIVEPTLLDAKTEVLALIDPPAEPESAGPSDETVDEHQQEQDASAGS